MEKRRKRGVTKWGKRPQGPRWGAQGMPPRETRNGKRLGTLVGGKGWVKKREKAVKYRGENREGLNNRGTQPQEVS